MSKNRKKRQAVRKEEREEKKMKKLLHEVIVIVFIVFAMYLISSSETLEESNYSKKSGALNGSYPVKTRMKNSDSKVSNRYESLKGAREDLKLYRLCKKYKFVPCVVVKVEDRLIDLNTCQAYELTAIKGIGKALSNRIIDHRTEQGLFYEPRDLINVKGIGEKKLNAILSN